MKWRILNTGKSSPEYNMALDEAIMEGVIQGQSQPTIRFYDWDPPTLSCGYNQSAEKEVNMELVKATGVGFVRRPTGGRLVFHKEEITYSVISPLTEKLAGNVTDSYAQISLALEKGFQLMHVAVELEKGSLSTDSQRAEANPCFSSTSRYELHYQQKKIVGSAQMRKETALLQHGSILLNYDQSIVVDYLPNLSEEQRAKLKDYLRRKTISINQILTSKIGYQEAVENFIEGFKIVWNDADFEFCDQISEFEEENLEKIKLSKYSTTEWNFRK